MSTKPSTRRHRYATRGHNIPNYAEEFKKDDDLLNKL